MAGLIRRCLRRGAEYQEKRQTEHPNISPCHLCTSFLESLAADQALMKRRIAGAFDLDLTGSSLQFLNVRWCQLDVQCAQVLFETLQLRRAGDWRDPRLLGQKPRERHLSGRSVLGLRETPNHIHERLIGRAILFAEPRNGIAEIRALELRVGVDLAGEETLSEWAERNETDT